MDIDIAGAGAIANLLKDGIDRIWPDPTQKAQAMLQIQQLDNQLAAGQAAIDQVEANNTSLFVSGWRPFIGWVCGLALAYHFIVEPLIVFTMLQLDHKVDLPTFDMASLSTILMGMLGLSTLRTAENMGARNHLPWQQNRND